VRGLLSLSDVAPVDKTALTTVLDMPLRDYKNAVLHQAAGAAGASAIVTRDRIRAGEGAGGALDGLSGSVAGGGTFPITRRLLD